MDSPCSSLHSSLPCQHLLSEPSLSDRALQTMSQTTPYENVPARERSKNQLEKGAKIMGSQLNRGPQRHRGFICSTQAHISYKRQEIKPLTPKAHNPKLRKSPVQEHAREARGLANVQSTKPDIFLYWSEGRTKNIC